ncbi:MAG: single-stranded DNA-binding protein [Defluviitaleaceae bacterium]|nr:single-stranded DNA-binding protein [Defluviitaleaceae bacterium]
MNKVILMGRLAKDPEIRYTQGGAPMCVARFTLAVERRFKKEGEPDADFIFCVAFRHTAEFMERYIKKGMQVSLCGSISVRSYDDNNGQRKWSTEVIADEVNFAESRAAFEARAAKGGNDYSSMPSAPPQPVSPEFKAITESIDEDDDLPF